MKHTILSLIAVAGAIALGAQSAKATEYRDADNWQTAGVGTLIGVGGSVTSDFNIVVDEAQADTFTVDSPPYSVSTQNGGATFTSALGYTPGNPVLDGTVSFWLRNTDGDTITILVGIGTLLTSADSGGVVFQSQNLNLTLRADLQADGIITYTVSNTGPTAVNFDYALLSATVPDGGLTIAFLGSAIVGLGLLRRKLS